MMYWNQHRAAKLLCFLALCAATAAVLLFENGGGRTRVQIRLSGDLGRETRWLGQYGQFACVVIVAALIWSLDAPRRRALPILLAAVLATASITVVVKRLTGRVRPSFDEAGQFLGPAKLGGAAFESFPSGHTASAVALTVVLSRMYPRARGLFWALAVACGALRWVRDAHWLSDVFAGAAVGFAVAHLALLLAERLSQRGGVTLSGAAAGATGALAGAPK
jgi:membrane-associated phospholipid phosphatase